MLSLLYDQLFDVLGLDSAFNICLVYESARPACFIEKGNYYSNTGLTPKDYQRHRKFLNKFDWKPFNLHLLEIESGIFIYKNRKPNLSTNLTVGRSLGFDCPGQMDGQVTISYMVSQVNTGRIRPQNVNFYTEICNKLDQNLVDIKLAKFQGVASQLGLFVGPIIKKFYKTWELLEELQGNQPIPGGMLFEISNMFWNHGLFVSLRLIEKILKEDLVDYRPVIGAYIPIWMVLLAYCETNPILNLFGMAINREQVDVTWGEVNQQLAAWEKMIYSALPVSQ